MVRGPARRLFGLPIDLNCADAPTLEVLSGIGTVRARAILDERRIRAFSDVDDLMRVHGIGPKTLERLRPVVGVNSATAGSMAFPECRSNGELAIRPGSGGHG
jgi:type II secretory pathway component PulK